VELLRVAVDGDVEAVHAGFGQAGGVGQMRQASAVGHDADFRVPEGLGHVDEVGELVAGRRFARREAHFEGAAALFEDPADAIDGHGGVVDVPAVAVFFHAEDAVVVADGADRDVNALVSGRETFGDVRLGGAGTVGQEGLGGMVVQLGAGVNFGKGACCKSRVRAQVRGRGQRSVLLGGSRVDPSMGASRAAAGIEAVFESAFASAIPAAVAVSFAVAPFVVVVAIMAPHAGIAHVIAIRVAAAVAAAVPVVIEVVSVVGVFVVVIVVVHIDVDVVIGVIARRWNAIDDCFGDFCTSDIAGDCRACTKCDGQERHGFFPCSHEFIPLSVLDLYRTGRFILGQTGSASSRAGDVRSVSGLGCMSHL
jgi:hypothetical protein